MPRKIETHMIAGPVGRLESLLEEPDEGAPHFAALVCHPHPQHGGTMHNKVVYRIARGLRKAGAVVLRFNYRGVNLSEGTYDHGVGETEDARACLEWLRKRYPQLPAMIAGFSFGSRIALRIGAQRPDLKKVIACGFPTVYKDRSYLDPCLVPRTFIHSTHDEFGPKDELAAVVAELDGPPELVFIEAKDHFFVDALDAFEQAVMHAAPKVFAGGN
ncbi:MAG: alpha/beta fold hydrolase [Acidobacteria bacterium]|nr:alpha/beta fold hydrolase [Acidobacteriota bacterium]